MDEKKYSQLYQALLQEVLQFHNGNQRRIRKGMLSLLLVPLVFGERSHQLAADASHTLTQGGCLRHEP